MPLKQQETFCLFVCRKLEKQGMGFINFSSWRYGMIPVGFINSAEHSDWITLYCMLTCSMICLILVVCCVNSENGRLLNSTEFFLASNSYVANITVV